MVLGGVMALVYLLMPRHKLSIIIPEFSLKSLRLSLRSVWSQCRIGISSLMGEFSLSVLVFVGNLVFMRFLGDDGVGAFGI
jgi:Na+-driven multidrug efflux pump